MARRRPRIQLTIIDQKGELPCHRGHRIGQSFDFDTDRGRLCPMAMHCGFPYIDILRYGGSLPGQEEGTAVFCCSDADTVMVFRAQILPDPLPTAGAGEKNGGKR